MYYKIKYFISIIFFILCFQIYGDDSITPVINDLNDKPGIHDKILLDYFGVDLGAAYDEVLKIIKDAKLDFIKGKDLIELKDKLSGFEKIESTYFYFTENTLTGLSVKIYNPEEDIIYYYNNLKKYHEIRFTDDSNEKALWTDNNITLELKREKHEDREYIYINYFINRFPVIKDKEFRAIGFSFGGGLNHNLGMSDLIGVMSFDVLLPFTFMYYPDIKRGFGFTLSTGTRINLVYSSGLSSIDLVNILTFTYKKGRIDKLYFLMDIGLDITARFLPFPGVNMYCRYGVFEGFHMFFGAENRSQKKFSFALGGTFGAVIGFMNQDNYNYIYKIKDNQYLSFHILAGMDLKWRFNIIKDL